MSRRFKSERLDLSYCFRAKKHLLASYWSGVVSPANPMRGINRTCSSVHDLASPLRHPKSASCNIAHIMMYSGFNLSFVPRPRSTGYQNRKIRDTVPCPHRCRECVETCGQRAPPPAVKHLKPEIDFPTSGAAFRLRRSRLRSGERLQHV